MGKQRKEEPKAGVPGWLVSFGDMMTLILTFFILLVSMASTQSAGLMAKGLGSFMIALQSHGLDGVLDEEQELFIHNEYRRRFNLPPTDKPLDEMDEASDLEVVKAQVAKMLAPHDELTQPQIALFERDSSELRAQQRRYLDQLAPTLRPGLGQILVLEGHALDAGAAHGGSNMRLAYARARATREYLIEEHGFAPGRVEARAWLAEIDQDGASTRSVDGRLVTPLPAGRR